MRAPFRESPEWGDPEDFGAPCPPELTVWVDDDDRDVLVDADGCPLRPRMPFGFCRQEAGE